MPPAPGHLPVQRSQPPLPLVCSMVPSAAATSQPRFPSLNEPFGSPQAVWLVLPTGAEAVPLRDRSLIPGTTPGHPKAELQELVPIGREKHLQNILLPGPAFLQSCTGLLTWNKGRKEASDRPAFQDSRVQRVMKKPLLVLPLISSSHKREAKTQNRIKSKS